MPIRIENIDRSGFVQVKDLRPPSELDGEVFSYLITSDAYGVHRVSDASMQPAPLRLLQHRAWERIGTTTEPLTVTVKNFVIYRNVSGPGKQVASAAVGGALGSALGSGATTAPTGTSYSVADRGAFDSVGSAEWKRALFSQSENPTSALCFIIYIDTEIQGKRVFTRTLHTTARTDFAAGAPKAVELAIEYHLGQYGK